jgi:hypothetical protein
LVLLHTYEMAQTGEEQALANYANGFSKGCYSFGTSLEQALVVPEKH